MDKNYIYLLSSAHPKISPGEIVRIFKKYYCKGDISKASGDQKKSYGVENFSLMDTILQLLVREETV